ncbi:MAG: arginine decarboxylase, pyruvoyl-dependent [Candidatus Brockarchaeota archaeon]|nr:arginine decarboxylase, pyruvoyl-dependent [Candidatus Brockarchaeota archaeon]
MAHPIIPRRIFLTKGVGKHKEKLQSFELALRDAGIAKCNLVGVSSIFPPGCKLVSTEEGLQYIQAGQILFSVFCSNSTNEPNRLIAASVGLAIPQDRTMYGYLSEHTSFGETAKKAGDYAEDLAATMLATTLGIRFSVDDSYDEKKKQWRISGKIVKTTNVTQSSEGDKNGLWTTVVAAAVFI